MTTQLRTRQLSFSVLAVLLALSTLLLITSLTLARPTGTIIVNSGDSIQAAIDSATSGDTIVINAGTYTESLTLSKAVSLTGVNSATVIIHAVPNQRVITVTGSTIDASVVISGLTFTGGNVGGTANGGAIWVTAQAQPIFENLVLTNNIAYLGGGIAGDRNLILINVAVLRNTASAGGGIYAASLAQLTGGLVDGNQCLGSTFIPSGGGGLHAAGLIMTGTVFSNNTSGPDDGGGGAWANSAELTGGQFLNNHDTRGSSMGLSGGGIAVEMTLTTSGTHFIGNTSNLDCGGASALSVIAVNSLFENNRAAGFDSHGGGVCANSLVVSNTRFISNSADFAGGGIYVSEATIDGGWIEANSAEVGAGAYTSAVGSLTLTNTDVVSNVASSTGGGIAVGTGTLVNSRFMYNKAIGRGGGARTFGDLIAINSEFVSNTAVFGGGAFADDRLFLFSSRFDENQANLGDGGGVYALGLMTMSETQFLNNTAGSDGGGAYAWEMTISGGKFEGNRTSIKDSGGGGALTAGRLTMSGTQFLNNTTPDYGGAVLIVDDGGRLINVLFAGNMAGEEGAALYAFFPAGLTVLHTSVVDASLNPKSGIFINGGSVGITDTVVANHTFGIVQNGGSLYQDYNLFFGNTTNMSGAITGGTHDVFGDPNFVDPANGDYHIAPPSAAIDAGTDAGVYTDLDGNVRPMGGGFDIGAYEVVIATVPITGLVAVNDSPTRLGEETMFVAMIQAGDAVSYRWNFGDGSALGTYQTVSHTYASAGIYTAIVTASNSLSTVTATTTVTVYVTPVAGLTVSNTSPTVLGQPTGLLAAISAGDFVSYTWNLGDGVSTAGVITTHTYPAVGVYTASVTAFNSVNALMATTRVTITDVPLSGLSASNSGPTAIGGVTTLTATIDAGSNVTYTWNFGDDSPLVAGQVVTHIYPFSATPHFTATVTAVNSLSTQSASTAVVIVPQRVYLPFILR